MSPFRQSQTVPAAAFHKLRAFTLVELLVVIGTISVLASMLLPLMSKATARAKGLVCVNNLRQLQMTMALYAADNEDFVVWNWPHLKRSWVYAADYTLSSLRSEGLTNTQWLIDPEYAAFAEYIGSPSTYRCPGDKTTISINGNRCSWVRSYGSTFRQRKMSGFTTARTSDGQSKSMAMVLTFGDSHPGYLLNLSYVCAEPNLFFGFPASWHHQAGALAFADGHAELHRWIDERTRRPAWERAAFDSSGTLVAVRSPGNPDAQWLYDRVPAEGFDRQDWDILRLEVRR